MHIEKFWIVLTGTDQSVLVDVVYECTVSRLHLLWRNGTTPDEVVAIYVGENAEKEARAHGRKIIDAWATVKAAREFVFATLPPSVHEKDEDCDVDPETATCRTCHVYHDEGNRCVECGGRAFHKLGCETVDGQTHMGRYAPPRPETEQERCARVGESPNKEDR
jgi:hypothetical protein